MPKTIQQTVRFNVTCNRLYETYIDSKKHSAATNSRAFIGRRVGGKFSAYDDTSKEKIK